MKLCITATGNNLEAMTDASFGRTPWFILVDTDGDGFEAIENSSVNASQGAGIAATQTIADKKTEALLTGRIGPKAQAALSASNIKMYEGLGQSTVAEALEQFRKGQYKESGTGGTGAGSGSAGTGAGAANAGAGSGSGGCGCGQGGGRGRGMGGGKGRGMGGGGGMGGGRGNQ